MSALPQTCESPAMSLTLQDAFDTYAVAVWDKQMHLNELVGEADWELDVEAGQIAFSNGRRWSIQILGSESFQSDTWLWAWANAQSRLPESLLRMAQQVREFGEQHDIDELIQPDIPLDWGDSHLLGSIAAGLCGADAYYRCPHSAGAVCVLINDEKFPRPAESPLAKLPELVFDAINNLDIRNHRLALTSFLRQHQVTVQESVEHLEAQLPTGPLQATLDHHNRIQEISLTKG